METLMRQAGVRAREALIGAESEALCAVTTQDASGFFRRWGYLEHA